MHAEAEEALQAFMAAKREYQSRWREADLLRLEVANLDAKWENTLMTADAIREHRARREELSAQVVEAALRADEALLLCDEAEERWGYAVQRYSLQEALGRRDPS